MILYTPGLYLYGLCDIYRRYLNCFRKNFLPMLSFSVSVAIHPIWLYIFVVQFELDLQGIALAGTISNLISFGLMYSLLY